MEHWGNNTLTAWVCDDSNAFVRWRDSSMPWWGHATIAMIRCSIEPLRRSIISRSIALYLQIRCFKKWQQDYFVVFSCDDLSICILLLNALYFRLLFSREYWILRSLCCVSNRENAKSRAPGTYNSRLWSGLLVSKPITGWMFQIT